MTGIHNENRKALEAAMIRLGRAETHFHEQTIPHTPLGRPRIFRVANLYWPVKGRTPGGLESGKFWYFPWPEDPTPGGQPSPVSFYESMGQILAGAHEQPRRVWRVIRQINAIAAWCEKRAEGRKRAALEILKQQSPWVNKIASEVLVNELASGIGPTVTMGKERDGFTRVVVDGKDHYLPIFDALPRNNVPTTISEDGKEE